MAVPNDDYGDDALDSWLRQRRRRQEIDANTRAADARKRRPPLAEPAPRLPSTPAVTFGPDLPARGEATVTAGAPMPVATPAGRRRIPAGRNPDRFPVTAAIPEDPDAPTPSAFDRISSGFRRGVDEAGQYAARGAIGAARGVGEVAGFLGDMTVDMVREHPIATAGWIVAPEVMAPYEAARLGKMAGTYTRQQRRGIALDREGQLTEEPVSGAEVAITAIALAPVIPFAVKRTQSRLGQVDDALTARRAGLERDAAMDARYPDAFARAQEQGLRARAAKTAPRQPETLALPPGQYEMPGVDWATPLERTKTEAAAASSERWAGREGPRALLPPSPEERLAGEWASERVATRRRFEEEPPSRASADVRGFQDELAEGRRRAGMTTSQRSAFDALQARDRRGPRGVAAPEIVGAGAGAAAGGTAGSFIGDTPEERRRNAALGAAAGAGAGWGMAGAGVRASRARRAIVAPEEVSAIDTFLEGKSVSRGGDRGGYVGDRTYMVGARPNPRPIPPEEMAALSETERRVAGAARGPIDLRPAFEAAKRRPQSAVLQAEDDIVRHGGDVEGAVQRRLAIARGNRTGAVGDVEQVGGSGTPMGRNRGPATEHAASEDPVAAGAEGREVLERAQRDWDARGLDFEAMPQEQRLSDVRRHREELLAERGSHSDAGTFGSRLYSRTGRAINTAPFKKGTAEQWKAALSKGVPAAEREWAGLDKYLDANKGKVLTQDEVAGVFNKGRIRLKETVFGGDDTARQAKETAAREKMQAAVPVVDAATRRLNAALTDAGLNSSPHRARARDQVLDATTPIHDVVPSEVTDELRQAASEFRNAHREHRLATEAYQATSRYAGGASPARFDRGDLKLPGGSNYREVVISHDPPLASERDILEHAVGEAKSGKNRAAINGLQHALDRLGAADGNYDVLDILHEAETSQALNPREVAAARSIFNSSKSAIGSPAAYRSSHWGGVDNPLVHVRMTDRVLPSGEKATVVEEIQSDWHQAGKRKGYRGVESPKEAAARTAWKAADEEYSAAGERMDNARRRLAAREGTGPNYDTLQADPEYAAARADSFAALARRDVAEADLPSMPDSPERVPNAPFKKTPEWQELGLKRAIDEAVHNGSDRVTWVTGEQSADRYDLSRHVDEVEYNPETSRLVARKNGSVAHEGQYDAKALPDVIGKDAADKLLATERAARAGTGKRLEWQAGDNNAVFAPAGPSSYYEVRSPERDGNGRLYFIGPGGTETPLGSGTIPEMRKKAADLAGAGLDGTEGAAVHRLTGVDLKVGGEFHRFLYDRSLPQVVRDYAKKLGVKIEIEPVDLDLARRLDANQVRQHAATMRRGQGPSRARNRQVADTIDELAAMMEKDSSANWEAHLDELEDTTDIPDAVTARVRKELQALDPTPRADGEYVGRPDGPFGNAGPDQRIAGPDVDSSLDVLRDMIGDDPEEYAWAIEQKLVETMEEIVQRMSPDRDTYRTFGEVMRDLDPVRRGQVEEFMEIKPWEPPVTSSAKNLSFKITPELAAKVKRGQPLGFADTPVVGALAGAGAGATAGSLVGDTPEERRRNAAAGAVAGGIAGAAGGVLIKGSRAKASTPALAKVAGAVAAGERTAGSRSFLTNAEQAYTDVVDEVYPLAKFGRVGDPAHPERLAQRVAAGQGWRAQARLHMDEQLGPIVKAAKGREADVEAFLVAQRDQQLRAQGAAPKTKFTDAELQAAIADGQRDPVVAGAARRLQGFYRGLLKMRLDAGLIDQPRYDAIVQSEDFYTPFVREWGNEGAAGSSANSAGKFINRGGGVRKMDRTEGARADIRSAFEQAVLDASETHRQVAKQRVFNVVADIVENNPGAVDQIVRELPKGSTAEATAREVKGIRNGEQHRYEILDKDFHEALGSFDARSEGLAVKVGGAFKRMLQAGVTLLPDFAVANLLRDTGSAAVQEAAGALGKRAAMGAAGGAAIGAATASEDEDTFTEALKGAGYGTGVATFGPQVLRALGAVKSIVTNDATYRAFLKSGAATEGFYPRTPKDARQALQRLERSGVNPKDILVPSRWVDAMRAIGSTTEQATRLATFTRARGSGAGLDEAALAAQDVSLRFANVGKRTKGVAAVTAFWNAKVQGWDKLARMLKNPKTAAAGVATLTAPSLALWATNKDNPEYWERPQWERNMFWLLPKAAGGFYRIPKPFELGFLFASLPERLADFAYQQSRGEDGQPGESFAAGARDLLVNTFEGTLPIPTAITPVLEQFAGEGGYDFFRGRPIVDRPDLPRAMQQNERTSIVAKSIGEATGLSPQRVDHVIRSLTGTAGTLVSTLVDRAAQRTGVDERPAQPETPLLTRRFVTQDAGSTDQEQTIRRRYADAERLYRGARALEKGVERGGDKAQLEQYVAEHREELRARARLKEVIDGLNDLADRRKALRTDPKLSATERKEQLQILRALGREIADYGLKAPAPPAVAGRP